MKVSLPPAPAPAAALTRAQSLPLWFAEFLRYLLAGGLAFSIDVGLFQLALRVFDWPPLPAAVLGYSAGLVTVYFISIGWVFAHRRLAKPPQEFLLFAAIGLVGLAVNIACIHLLSVRLGHDPLLAKIIATALTFGLNFALRKLALFTPRVSAATRTGGERH